MSQTGIEDFLDIMLTNKPSKEKLEKLGLSKVEIKKFLESLIQGKENKAYNRILSEDEKRTLTPEAFGYLVHLLSLKSIDRQMFERIITLSMQLNLFMRKRIDRIMMDDIVNYIVFSGRGEVTVKDLLDAFFVQDSEIEFDDEIN